MSLLIEKERVLRPVRDFTPLGVREAYTFADVLPYPTETN